MNYLREFKKTPGWETIFAERTRQTREEGWTDEADARLPTGALLESAKCYMDPEAAHDVVPGPWPFDDEKWKPKERKRNLVKAGALCLAEIDRTARQYHRPVSLHALDDKFAESLRYMAYVATLVTECAVEIDDILRGEESEL